MDSAASFFVCLSVCLCGWLDSTGEASKKPPVRPGEGTHSPFSAAYTSLSELHLHILAEALIRWSLPRLLLSHQGNHFLFRKAHSEDPFIWLHVML